MFFFSCSKISKVHKFFLNAYCVTTSHSAGEYIIFFLELWNEYCHSYFKRDQKQGQLNYVGYTKTILTTTCIAKEMKVPEAFFVFLNQIIL